MSLDTVALPSLGAVQPGARVLIGVPEPRLRGEGGLPDGFEYQIGTIGAVASTGGQPYLVTAGHVVRHMGSRVSFPPPGTHLMVGVYGRTVQPASTDGSRHVRPAGPVREDGALVDAVAIPIPESLAVGTPWRLAVDGVVGLELFRQRQAYLLVERLGRPRKLWGVVVDVPSTGLDDDDVRRPQRVVFRFDGELSVEGDSGAPLLALLGGELHLLGFHYGKDAQGHAIATAASAALSHMTLSLST